MFPLCVKKLTENYLFYQKLSNLMSFQQRRFLMKSFFKAHFGYCPLVGIFHDREINRKFNLIDEGSLRIGYRDCNSSFKDLLEKDKSVCIHNRNIQNLTIELFLKYFSYQSITLQFKITNRFFQKYHQYHKIWFRLIKIFCIKSLEHNTYKN